MPPSATPFNLSEPPGRRSYSDMSPGPEAELSHHLSCHIESAGLYVDLHVVLLKSSALVKTYIPRLSSARLLYNYPASRVSSNTLTRSSSDILPVLVVHPQVQWLSYRLQCYSSPQYHQLRVFLLRLLSFLPSFIRGCVGERSIRPHI